MNEHQSLLALRELGLHGMADAGGRLLNEPDNQSHIFFGTFAFLIEAETHYREERRLKRFMSAAKLKIVDASLDNLDFNPNRGLDRTVIQSLATCRWVLNNQHLILLGATGAGKTHLACAFANQAIIFKHKAHYRRLPRLLEELEIARADGSLPELRVKLSKFKVLILDDWGLNALTARNRQDLLELVEDKTGTGSIIITSQLPINQWHDWIGDPTIADAILDRLVHRAHTINLQGDSMRKVLGLQQEK